MTSPPRHPCHAPRPPDPALRPCPEGMLPIFLPAATVRLLTELCQAAEFEGGADGLADFLFGRSVREALRSNGWEGTDCRGTMADIREAFEIGEEDPRLEAMFEVVDRWNAEMPEEEAAELRRSEKPAALQVLPS